MPQIAPEEFERLPLHGHTLMADVALRDAWVVDLPSPHAGITLAEFLQRAGNLFREPPPVVRALLSIRFFVGGLFGWDHEEPCASAESFARRLTTEDYARSLAPPGTQDGLFRLVYRFENEQLSEIVNRTVHAGTLYALVETAEGYRLYLGIYVREVSCLTPLYMAAIDPFRKMIVYPALLDGIVDKWRAAFWAARPTSA
jgi:hypothetical protein